MVYKNKHGRRQKRPSTHKGKGKELGIGERCVKVSGDVMTCHRLRYAGNTCEHLGYDGELHARGTPYGKPHKTMSTRDIDVSEVIRAEERVKTLRSQSYPEVVIPSSITSYLVDKETGLPLSGVEFETNSIEVKKLF